AAQRQQPTAAGAEFVPMTPHTRRDASLLPPAPAGAGPGQRLASVRGGMCVAPLPGRPGGGGADESVVMWVGGADHVAVIPRVACFWDAQERRSRSAAGGGVNLFSGAPPTRMVPLDGLAAGLMGERCAGVGAVAVSSRHPHRGG